MAGFLRALLPDTRCEHGGTKGYCSRCDDGVAVTSGQYRKLPVIGWTEVKQKPRRTNRSR